MRKPWLIGPWFDGVLILFPPVFSILFVLLFKDHFENILPLWGWVVFVLGVDVAHVYSTLFKTYFHRDERERFNKLLIFLPVVVFIVGVIVHTISGTLFWTLLAYLAVFHFIRQQYGFMRLYSRADGETLQDQRLDELMIYAATLWPVIFWHTHERQFHWFMEGDFVPGLPEFLSTIGLVMYIGIFVFWAQKEMRTRVFNLPKLLIILGTALSWLTGIVLLNGDFSFTVINVIAHGIPYMALIWAWNRKKETSFGRNWYALPFFLGVILLLAFVEEGIWAGFVWREHLEFFSVFSSLPKVTSRTTLSLIVPLLTLPQAVHYALDGFIWKKAFAQD